MTLGFPKASRLLKSSEYSQVLRKPERKLAAGPLRIRAIQNRMRTARLGLVVTKKGNPTAVRRNRIKRLIRETFRANQCRLQGVDIVVQVLGPVEDEKFLQELEGMFAKIARG